MFIRLWFTVLVLFSLVTVSFARDIGIAQCGTNQNMSQEYFIELVRSPQTNDVAIYGIERGRRFRLGSLSQREINQIDPSKRVLGSRVAAVGSGVGMILGALGTVGSGGIMGVFVGGVSLLGSSIGANFIDGISHDSLKYRARLEKCFKQQANGRRALIQITSRKEFEKSVHQFKDLISDMHKNTRVARDNSDRLPAAKANLGRRPAFPVGSTGNMR